MSWRAREDIELLTAADFPRRPCIIALNGAWTLRVHEPRSVPRSHAACVSAYAPVGRPTFSMRGPFHSCPSGRGLQLTACSIWRCFLLALCWRLTCRASFVSAVSDAADVARRAGTTCATNSRAGVPNADGGGGNQERLREACPLQRQAVLVSSCPTTGHPRVGRGRARARRIRSSTASIASNTGTATPGLLHHSEIRDRFPAFASEQRSQSSGIDSNITPRTHSSRPESPH
jgi:hypothetical protein